MINPTWQDKDRRIIYVKNEYLRLVNPEKSKFAIHGNLVVWSESNVTVELDGNSGFNSYNRRNLFWEDGEEDFDEVKSIHKNETEKKNSN